MKIHTVDEQFDYRLAQAIKRAIRLADGPVKFEDGDHLADWLWANLETLGQAVHKEMYEWMPEDDWLEAVQK